MQIFNDESISLSENVNIYMNSRDAVHVRARRQNSPICHRLGTIDCSDMGTFYKGGPTVKSEWVVDETELLDRVEEAFNIR